MNNNKAKEKLTKLEHYVTQDCGTEKPFDNKYWDNKEEGIYVDIISGDVLFCSLHKFDSGTGWPSFYDVVDINNLTKHTDMKLGYKRTEVKSFNSNAHLGHVFNDGPNNNPRYCINSASLRFVHKKDMKIEGYGKYLILFNK